ncbi:MAG: hypothetical protein GY722_01545 [bacterium]|nr:hypothetical protein [bacterium]
MARLTTIQIPLQWETYGLPARFQTSTTCLVSGDPGWAWDNSAPDLDISLVDNQTGDHADGWDLDHVVLLVPDLAAAIESVLPSLGRPRLRAEVEGRPTCFYRVGPLLEVIESPVRAASLFGIALVTDHSLEETALGWRESGVTVTEPQPAIQPGREIFSVKGTSAGFAVLSPDGTPGPTT